MPKTVTVGVLYDAYEIDVKVPSDYNEGDSLVGQIGGVLDGFISDCTARNFLPRLYAGVSKQLAEQGFKRAETKESTPEKVIWESHIKHIYRFREAADDDAKTTLGAMLQKIADEIPFFQRGDRTGSGKITQAAIDTANSLFAEGDDAVANAVVVMEAGMPGLKIDRDAEGAVTPEGLARGVQKLNRYLVKQHEQTMLQRLREKT